MFSGPKIRCLITEKQLKYYTFEYRKATNCGKLYLLPKLFNVSGRPVFSNFDTPIEKCSELLEYHLNPI